MSLIDIDLPQNWTERRFNIYIKKTGVIWRDCRFRPLSFEDKVMAVVKSSHDEDSSLESW